MVSKGTMSALELLAVLKTFAKYKYVNVLIWTDNMSAKVYINHLGEHSPISSTYLQSNSVEIMPVLSHFSNGRTPSRQEQSDCRQKNPEYFAL